MDLAQYAPMIQKYLYDHPRAFKAVAWLATNIVKSLTFLGLVTGIIPLINYFLYFENFGKSNVNVPIDLINKRDKYLDLSHTVQDAHGFVETVECDSLIFTGLYGAFGLIVDITAACSPSGQWFRKPGDDGCCWRPEDTFNGSTISRDMFTGLLWYIWKRKRLDLAEELYQYGQKNYWIMGQGDPGRLYFVPGLQAALAEIIYKLGGKNRWVARRMPQIWPTNLLGYEAHLELLSIAILGSMNGSIDGFMLTAVKAMYERNPQNPLTCALLHKYTDGDQTETYDILMNEQYYPKDRLPTESDRSARWLPERESIGTTDYQPGTGSRVWSGGDLVFVVGVMEQ